MITVKKLKSGKIKVSMDYHDAEEISTSIMSYLETESVRLMSVNLEKGFTDHLTYNLLNEFMLKNTLFFVPTKERSMSVTRSQCLALIWLCSDIEVHTTNPIFQLKCALHKLLS